MKILMAAYGGGHINIIINLYIELRKRGIEPIVLGLTMGIKKLKEHKIPYLSYLDFLEASDQGLLKLGEELCSTMSLNSSIPYRETVAYMGVNYSELVYQFGEKRARELYDEKGRQAFYPKRFVGRILDRINPDIVITTNSPRTEEAIVREAMNRKLPTYVVSDFYSAKEIKDRTGDPSYCSKIFVTVDKMKKELISKGWDASRVLLYGNPAFDGLFDPIDSRSEIFFKNNLSLDDKSLVILWVKSVFPKIKDLEEKTEELLIDYVKNRRNIKLLIKPHPNDPNKYFSQKNYSYITNEVPLYDLIKKTNLIVTVNSTVGLEASMLGKRVIQVSTFKYPEKVPFEELNIGKEVKSLSHLVEELDHNLYSEKEVNGQNRMQKATPQIINEILADIKIL